MRGKRALIFATGIFGLGLGILASGILRPKGMKRGATGRRLELEGLEQRLEEEAKKNPWFVVDHRRDYPERGSEGDPLDLNSATEMDLMHAGIGAELAARIVENRPYLTRIDLISRRVVPDAAYSLLKNRVEVRKAS